MEQQDNGMIRFEVRNVTEADLGKYRCHASNIYGYDNSIAQLNFESKRIINGVFLLGLGAICFAAKSLINTLVARRPPMPSHSARSVPTASSDSVPWRLVYLATYALLTAFCVFVSFSYFLGDHSVTFPCDDNLQIKSITEYVFKCGHT